MVFLKYYFGSEMKSFDTGKGKGKSVPVHAMKEGSGK
jgi:hypothetical protein